MKTFTKRKSMLGILLCLAMLAAMLVPAMPVAAAVQDWPVEIVGYSTVNLTKAEFDAMWQENPITLTEPGTTPAKMYQGVALWRLVALVDGGDPTELDTSLAPSINVKGTSADDYENNALTPDIWYGVDGANKDNVIVYNRYSNDGGATWIDAVDASDGAYPCKIFGLNLDGTKLSGSYRPGKLIRLELQGLPQSDPDEVTVSAQSQSVANGATFNEEIYINTSVPTRGWGMTVSFDPAKLQAKSVTEGTFLSAYAAANGGGTVSGGAATIDNTAGTVTIPGYAITGAGTSGPTGSGTLCTISFTALADNTSATIGFPAATVKDVNGISIPGVTTSAGTVGIGGFPMPDLRVSSAYYTWTSDTEYTVTYTIINSGNADAEQFRVAVTRDGTEVDSEDITGLAAGDSATYTTPTLSLSDSADTVIITVDSNGAVAESNESNNTRTLNVSKGPNSEGDTIIDGNINTKLEFTAPADISGWMLDVGNNTNSGSMNVKSNSGWQVTVSDQNNGGHLAKWSDGEGFAAPTVELTDALQVTGNGDQIVLSGTPQTIATGDPSGQNLDAGQDIGVTYDQTVYYADPVLTGGYSYRIILSFTASLSID